jgi:hypothetical protein
LVGGGVPKQGHASGRAAFSRVEASGRRYDATFPDAPAWQERGLADLLLLPLHQPGLWLVLLCALAVLAVDGWLHRR